MPARRRLQAVLLLSGALAGCGAGRPVHQGPIVVLTENALRADVVASLGGTETGLTPNLDALVRGADWAGRAIAPSSWVIPSTASLLTGLRPWQHQALALNHSDLSADLLTLPEALREAGYRTHGYYQGRWMAREAGYGQGFDSYDLLGNGGEATERLAHLSPGRELVWIHIPEPQPPYVRRNWLRPRVKDSLPNLPEEVRSEELAKYFDPAIPLPEAARRRFWDLYRQHVAWADERLGQLLDALRKSGQWDRTLIVFASTHGEEFGERGQIEDGGNLGRRLIEVPLVVKLPAGWRRPIAAGRHERVAAARLWATVVEAAGGPVPPAVAPSLFTHTLRPLPAEAELYAMGNLHRFTVIDGDDQLFWDVPFAAPEREYYRARLESLPGSPPAQPPLAEPEEVIFARLEAAFTATRPLTGVAGNGGGGPRLALERWIEGENGSRPVEDPRRRAEMAALLVRCWRDFVAAELPPAAEAAARRLPSVSGAVR